MGRTLLTDSAKVAERDTNMGAPSVGASIAGRRASQASANRRNRLTPGARVGYGAFVPGMTGTITKAPVRGTLEVAWDRPDTIAPRVPMSCVVLEDEYVKRRARIAAREAQA